MSEITQRSDPGDDRERAKGAVVNRWYVKRKAPYARKGIERLTCIRCGAPAEHQWQICSDGNNWRPLCITCDIALNELVLNWMGHPDACKLILKYTEQIKA